MALEFFSELGKVKVLMLKGQKGDKGEDGTSGDYTGLTNKPTINGVTVDGALTSDDLGLASQTALDAVSEDTNQRVSDVETHISTIENNMNPEWTTISICSDKIDTDNSYIKYREFRNGIKNIQMHLKFSSALTAGAIEELSMDYPWSSGHLLDFGLFTTREQSIFALRQTLSTLVLVAKDAIAVDSEIYIGFCYVG